MKRRWQSGIISGLPRTDRASCDYEAYIPDPLVARTITLDGGVAADVANAERAITRFDAGAKALVDTEALARLLLRAEAVASSRIENLEVGGRRLLRAELARSIGDVAKDVTATEVFNNILAMQWALETVNEGDDITVDVLLEAHRRLLADTRIAEHGGHVREEQNWIGGSSYNPCSAAFVPPPPERVNNLLDDLCAFSNSNDLPVVAQAAIAHAQFETIHPFVDGNGRIGRVLIHLVLRRRGMTTQVLPPVSLILATWSGGYVDGLMGTRYLGSPSSAGALEGMNRWIAFFATATSRAIEDASEFEDQVALLQANWRKELGRVRSGSAVDLLIRALPGAPIMTVSGAADLIGRTFQATNQAVTRMVDAGILAQVNVGHRNRAFEAPAIIRTFTDLERRLASPTGDARSSRPTRRVPGRVGAIGRLPASDRRLDR
jgi:Fic family protein